MKLRYLRELLFVCACFISQPIMAGGVDIFTTTQSSAKENLEISCTSTFKAPYDDLYAYESVWNWILFSGGWSLVPVKVGEKYTGEFSYAGMSCIAKRKTFDTATQQNSTAEVSFNFGVDGNLTVTSSNVPLNTPIESYKNSYETAKLVFTISKLAYEVNKVGIVAALIDTISIDAIAQSAAMSVVVHLVSNSVFIYIEQNEIKKQISKYMNNEAASATKNVTERLLTNITQFEATYRYSIIMPAINYLL